MNEVIPIIPVVEVREAFTLSERLRMALGDFFDPDLDDERKESLRAALFLRSYRRRVIESDDYYMHEYDRNGMVYEATREFERLPRTPIQLIDVLGIDNGSERSMIGRIVLRVQSEGLMVQASRVLDEIPSIEDPPRDPVLSTLLYAEVAKRSLMSPGQRRSVVGTKLRMEVIDPKTAAQYYVTPHAIMLRDTVMRVKAVDGKSAP